MTHVPNPYLNQFATCHGQTFTINVGNLFLYNAICNVTNGDDIVQFSGHRIAKLFDMQNRKPHATIAEGSKLRHWGDIANMVNQTQQEYIKKRIPNHAVQLHNYHKLGDFMLLFRDEYMRGGPDRLSMARGGPKAEPLTATQFNWAIDKGQMPVVLTNWGDENWGFLSGRESMHLFILLYLSLMTILCITIQKLLCDFLHKFVAIGTRTTKWLNMTNHLKIHISTYETVHMLLDSDKVFTSNA